VNMAISIQKALNTGKIDRVVVLNIVSFC